VCVKSAGEDTGTLSLRALELVDVEAACTGDEATRDTSCGGSSIGELSPSLLQQVGLGTCPSVPSTTNPPLDRRLPSLQENPLVLATRLRPEQVTCVRLRLRYEPPTTDASVASQSDRTSWRYEFSLVSR